jgi:hypothetical protein
MSDDAKDAERLREEAARRAERRRKAGRHTHSRLWIRDLLYMRLRNKSYVS